MQEISVPEPSKLYSLKPEGIGTSEVESLASYAMRLSEAHLIDICVLVHRFIYPLTRRVWKDVRLRGRTYKAGPHKITHAHYYVAKWLGMEKEAKATVAALSELTKRDDLHLLTTLPLEKYFLPHSVLKPRKSWCPCCYEDQRASGRPVCDLLLWSIQTVKVCPRHAQKLWSKCYWCGAGQPILLNSSQPGYCAKCYMWLGAAPRDSLKANHQDLVEANLVANLVAAFPLLPIPGRRNRPPLRNLVAKAQTYQCQIRDLLR
jgi:hypothetical protein